MHEAAVTVLDHPTVATLVAELRDERTGSDRFRVLVGEVSRWVAYEALRDLETEEVALTTPVGPATGRRIVGGVLIVPVLRAGLGMVDGVQHVVPGAAVAHLGMRRNEETLVASTYLDGVPSDLTGRRVVVCDPMVATGGSIVQACELVAARGASRIDALGVIASRPGVERVHAALPQVRLVCAALDDRLDERGYIVPGLGDAGDRLFGPPPS
jgi:uracil phosphoribosyltransferase